MKDRSSGCAVRAALMNLRGGGFGIGGNVRADASGRDDGEVEKRRWVVVVWDCEIGSARGPERNFLAVAELSVEQTSKSPTLLRSGNLQFAIQNLTHPQQQKRKELKLAHRREGGSRGYVNRTSVHMSLFNLNPCIRHLMFQDTLNLYHEAGVEIPQSHLENALCLHNLQLFSSFFHQCESDEMAQLSWKRRDESQAKAEQLTLN